MIPSEIIDSADKRWDKRGSGRGKSSIGAKAFFHYPWWRDRNHTILYLFLPHCRCSISQSYRSIW